MSAQSQLKTYSQIDAQGSIENASPHRIVQILMENALDRLGKAKAFMQSNNIHDKGLYISMAITIIDGLKASLDLNQGGQIADNLNKLYEYMMDTLVQANLNNNIDQIDEIINLIREIKEGWDQIPEDYHNKVDHE